MLKKEFEVLNSIKYNDEIKVYTYEKELIELLKTGEFNLMFLGDDYIGIKSFTGNELNIDEECSFQEVMVSNTNLSYLRIIFTLNYFFNKWFRKSQ